MSDKVMEKDLATQEVKIASDSNWRGLFKIAGVAGIIAGLLCVADIMVFVFFPQPATVQGWFTLFQKNWLLGLLDTRSPGNFCIRRPFSRDSCALRWTQENEPGLGGDSHDHDFRRDGSLLFIEHRLLPPLHKQSIRCCNDGCAESCVHGGGTNTANYVLTNCFQ